MKLVHLKEIATVSAGQGAPKNSSDFSEEGIPFIRAGSLDKLLEGASENSLELAPESTEKKYKLRLYPSGSVLFAKSGMSATKDRVYCLKKPAYVVNHLAVIVPNNDINSTYLTYVLRRFKPSRLIKDKAYPSINLTAIESHKVLIPYKDDKPDIETQIRIATLLSRVEALIATRKNNLQQLDNFLKSTFLDLFGDPVRNEKGWDKVPLSKFGKISTGNTPPRKDPDNFGGGYIEWIKTDNITNESIYVTKAREYLTELGASKGRFLKNGAILVACIAGSVDSIGRAAITDRDIAFNQQINAIQPNSDVDSIWIYWLFRLSKNYIQNLPAKGMKKIITKSVFENIELIKPPFDVQTKFSQIARNGEGLKRRLCLSLENLESLYAALSQKAFKGELDLSRVSLPEDTAPKVREVKLTDIVTAADQIKINEYPLSDPQARKALLRNLFDAWLAEQKDQSLSLEVFWQHADVKTVDLMDEADQPWNAKDYDQLKDWLFERIRDCKLEQTFVTNAGSPPDGQIELKAKS